MIRGGAPAASPVAGVAGHGDIEIDQAASEQ
jgi:hypothetical protein